MAEPFTTRLKNAWNTFIDGQQKEFKQVDLGSGYGIRPDRVRMNISNERSIVNSIYTRIAIDVAAVSIFHARLDNNSRYLETIDSGLNNCLTLEANVDQSGRDFIQDVVMSMFDEGVVAVVPVDTTVDPKVSSSFDIKTMRTGRIVSWYPRHVRVQVYNDRKGIKEEVTLPKEAVAIIPNPLYAVMNEPNSTLKRLIHKLNLLDTVDEQTSSGKLDLIIQLPYVIKSEARRQQAEDRRKDIEMQLKGSKYGIAYTDATERITQLNRPAENNLMNQVTYLTQMLYGQLGLTEEIFKGNADERTMLNYYNRTIEPILSTIVDAMRRTFLTKTARTQLQSIIFVRDPFRLVPISDIAEIADKFTRNEILSSNDVRAIIGWKPSSDPKADELRNKNLNSTEADAPAPVAEESSPY